MSPKSEKEKMLAGQKYNCLDPDLKSDREWAQSLLWELNRAEAAHRRQEILQQLLGSLGRESVIEPPFYCSYGQNIFIGSGVYLNNGCTILDPGRVRIGDQVMIGPNVQIYTAAHDLEAESRVQGWEVARGIEIGDRVWIGGSAVLLPGVRIGRNAVVGAGAVVTRDVPANAVAAGNPARVIRIIDQA